jgi:general secretion pathway protein G
MFHRLSSAFLLIITALSLSSCHAGRETVDKSLLHANETILRNNLFALRKSIDIYTANLGALPQSLDDSVKAGYLREIPDDPMTARGDWKVVTGDDPNHEGKKGIADVHSASAEKSSEGTLYNDW